MRNGERAWEGILWDIPSLTLLWKTPQTLGAWSSQFSIDGSTLYVGTGEGVHKVAVADGASIISTDRSRSSVGQEPTTMFSGFGVSRITTPPGRITTTTGLHAPVLLATRHLTTAARPVQDLTLRTPFG